MSRRIIKNKKIILILICIISSININIYAQDGNYDIRINNERLSSVSALSIYEDVYVSVTMLQKYLNAKVDLKTEGEIIQLYWKNNKFSTQKDGVQGFLNGSEYSIGKPVLVLKNEVYMPVSLLKNLLKIKFEVNNKDNYINFIVEMTQKNNSNKKNSEGKVKKAYLTFDDGLDRKVLPQILDILKQYEVKATFFIIGNTIYKNENLLKRIAAEGHSIGNHTYTHRKEIIYKDVQSFKEELDKTAHEIYKVTGIIPKLFRPPYGSTIINSQEYKEVLNAYTTVRWNVDSMDSRIKNIKSEDIIEKTINQISGKRSAIILFHSTSIHDETVKALPEIIKYLKQNNYSIEAITPKTKLFYEF